jgi:DNA-directed RNA polymerase specialized sigma24 family protein
VRSISPGLFVEREILASVAEGWTPQDTARHLDTSLRNITAAMHRMRDHYNRPTNECLSPSPYSPSGSR